MKHIIYTSLAILLSTAALSAERFYVAPHGTASDAGDTWATATRLTKVLAAARPGDEIWVMGGVYTLAGSELGRKNSFVVPAGVRLLGGFAGHESVAEERDPLVNRSVLSGELGDPSLLKDNAFTVVRLRSEGGLTSVVDGFVVTRGSARSFRTGFDNTTAGGGLTIEADANGKVGGHRLINCVFSHNTAHNGGAVYLPGGQPRFTNCTFRSNTADYNGGAVYNDGRKLAVNPIFEHCHFEDNAANSGGAMTNNGKNGEAVALARDCGFQNNVAEINGSVAYNAGNRTGTASIIVEGCTFNGNETQLGNMVATDGVTETIVQRQRRLGGGTLRPVKR